MNVELCYLVMSAALCLVLPLIYVAARTVSWGLTDVVGYPEDPPEVPAWSARLKLAHNNLVENLIPFACLVLVAQAAFSFELWFDKFPKITNINLTNSDD